MVDANVVISKEDPATVDMFNSEINRSAPGSTTEIEVSHWEAVSVPSDSQRESQLSLCLINLHIALLRDFTTLRS